MSSFSSKKIEKNIYSKLKYSSSCVKKFIDCLPKQLYGCIMPIHFNPVPNTIIDLQPNIDLYLQQPFYDFIPLHNNISLCCIFCNRKMNKDNTFYYVEQPHSRKRVTPICSYCTLK
jgi:hypothetical protein